MSYFQQSILIWWKLRNQNKIVVANYHGAVVFNVYGVNWQRMTTLELAACGPLGVLSRTFSGFQSCRVRYGLWLSNPCRRGPGVTSFATAYLQYTWYTSQVTLYCVFVKWPSRRCAPLVVSSTGSPFFPCFCTTSNGYIEGNGRVAWFGRDFLYFSTIFDRLNNGKHMLAKATGR